MSKRLEISAQHSLNDLTSVAKTVLPLAKQILGSKGMMQLDLLENWEEIVGIDLAPYCLPHKINFAKDKRVEGTIVIMAFGGAFALELANRKTKILHKINTFFGYSALSEMKVIQNNDPKNFMIKQNPSDKPKKNLVSADKENYITQITKDIADPQLRERLERLGRLVLNSKIE